MIGLELAFVIFFVSNLVAPALAFIAGRKWPGRRRMFHCLAMLWIVISIFICHKVTTTPAMIAAASSNPDGEDYEGLGQFVMLLLILLQQVLMLGAYMAWYALFGGSKTSRA